ncbi:MAG: hypothetical protein SVX43_09990 [Cyanobacteriota bacterium]|nr:hypothetical protein [Cyanobacteriota bacterium]
MGNGKTARAGDKEMAKLQQKRTYQRLLGLLALGTFGLFSDMDVSFLMKVYGIAIVLTVGITLLYFGVYQKRKNLDLN